MNLLNQTVQSNNQNTSLNSQSNLSKTMIHISRLLIWFWSIWLLLLFQFNSPNLNLNAKYGRVGRTLLTHCCFAETQGKQKLCVTIKQTPPFKSIKWFFGANTLLVKNGGRSDPAIKRTRPGSIRFFLFKRPLKERGNWMVLEKKLRFFYSIFRLIT